MGKPKPSFVCAGCRRPSARWSGKCPSCGQWGSVGEDLAGTGSPQAGPGDRSTILPINGHVARPRILTGLSAVDRVLGGGLVPGSVVLLAGAPGVGKSTLALQIAAALAAAGHTCLVASGEESRDQVAARAARLAIDAAPVAFVPGRQLSAVVAAAADERPDVVIVDSVHAIRDSSIDGLPGGPSQVRCCADALSALAKEQGAVVFLIGHVTKDGGLAGPRALEHAVDVVLTFEGEHRSGHRTLVSGKNRFGREGEVAWFDMRGAGLEEREDGPRLRGGAQEVGSATAVALAGRRAFAVDVQALAVATEASSHRQVAGLDPRRFHIIAAVTDRSTSLRLVRSDLYGASSGGLRLDDPGTDLAVAAALASSAAGIPPPVATGFVGEVSLTGAVREVGGEEQRLAAARAAGIRTVVCPWETGAGGEPPGAPRLMRVKTVAEALSWALRSRGPAGQRNTS